MLFNFLGNSLSSLITLLNAVCLLFAGFRSYQALSTYTRRGTAQCGRLPTFPEEDDAVNNPEEHDRQTVKTPLTVLISWMHYWTLFAILRTLEVYVSSQFATILLFIHIIVLTNQNVGPQLTATLFDASVDPLCHVLETNVAPKGQKFARFFHTSFAQAVRGIHTQFITLSIPNADDELLNDLTLHVVGIKKIIQTEKRRREVEELKSAGNSSSQHAKPQSAVKNPKSKDGLRKRKGMRQSLGLW